MESNEQRLQRKCRDQKRYRDKINKNPTLKKYLMMKTIQNRAEKEGCSYSLTFADMEVPAVCPVLGISLKQWGENNKPSHDSPSIDRLDPKGGYVSSNVRIISWRANKLKADASIQEIKAILEYMQQPPSK